MIAIINKIKNILNLSEQLELNSKSIIYNNRVDLLNYICHSSKEVGIIPEKYCDVEIIVSLTTYGKRLHDVYLTIESIMQQSRKANRIVLWLSEELKEEQLPMTILSQRKRGLEIHFCKDIKSYKKLIPSLIKFPDDVIITVDDDVLYDYDMLDKLVSSYFVNPNYIYYNRGHKIKFISDKHIEEYNNWEWNSISLEASPLNFPTGVGGILYPPKCFNEEVFNEEVFFDICMFADDVWFKAMALLNGTQSKKVYTRNIKGEEYIENPNEQDLGLGSVNNLLKQNDVQIKAIFDRYNIYEFFNKI